MAEVDPATVRDVFLILAAIVTTVCLIVNTLHHLKPRPSTETNLGTIATRISTLEKTHEDIEIRVTRLEDKLSKQIGKVHERINDVLESLSELKGVFKSWMGGKHD